MNVYVDGKLITVTCDVKVVYEDNDDDNQLQLHVTLTNEGIIKDIVDKDGEIVNTSCELFKIDVKS